METGKIRAAIEEFNKYRSPEAVAKLIDASGDLAIVKFSGPFCRGCGLYDYFDDLKIELERELGTEVEVLKIEGGGGESYLVTYRRKG